MKCTTTAVVILLLLLGCSHVPPAASARHEPATATFASRRHALETGAANVTAFDDPTPTSANVSTPKPTVTAASNASNEPMPPPSMPTADSLIKASPATSVTPSPPPPADTFAQTAQTATPPSIPPSSPPPPPPANTSIVSAPPPPPTANESVSPPPPPANALVFDQGSPATPALPAGDTAMANLTTVARQDNTDTGNATAGNATNAGVPPVLVSNSTSSPAEALATNPPLQSSPSLPVVLGTMAAADTPAKLTITGNFQQAPAAPSSLQAVPPVNNSSSLVPLKLQKTTRARAVAAFGNLTTLAPGMSEDRTMAASQQIAAPAAASCADTLHSCATLALKYCAKTWVYTDPKSGVKSLLATSVCPRRCGFCGCTDYAGSSECATLKSQGYCDPSYWYKQRWQTIAGFWCQATCGTCAGMDPSWSAAGPFTMRPFSIAGVGMYVYKTSASFESHIYRQREIHAGAHYYVQSPYTNKYSSAMTLAYLPAINPSLLKTKQRIACIAFTAYGGNGVVDFGVQNKGNGWFPFFWSGTLKTGGPAPTPADTFPTAARVAMSMNIKVVGGQDVVSMDYTFYAANGAKLGTRYRELRASQGQLFSLQGGAPMARFVRFMSLLHSNGANNVFGDVNDFTYMSNAKFASLQLYDWQAKKYVPWDASRIEHAWSSETANINTLAISPPREPTSDLFTCTQQYYYW